MTNDKEDNRKIADNELDIFQTKPEDDIFRYDPHDSLQVVDPQFKNQEKTLEKHVITEDDSVSTHYEYDDLEREVSKIYSGDESERPKPSNMEYSLEGVEVDDVFKNVKETKNDNQ
ncbi:hypothetical protein LAV77_19080 [Priestia megaterium]|uniref:hypothetical protein n=1 Tax=Priestia megaterium TaxID=1404 RepID=UPI002B254A2B|nr:hypothetical protein [Priestia megaterium]MEB2266913.1 hypothetical protein [Priestia megaterium]